MGKESGYQEEVDEARREIDFLWNDGFKCGILIGILIATAAWVAVFL